MDPGSEAGMTPGFFGLLFTKASAFRHKRRSNDRRPFPHDTISPTRRGV